VLATGDVGTVEGEDLEALKDIERRPPVRDVAGELTFEDLSDTDALSDEMGLEGTGGGLDE